MNRLLIPIALLLIVPLLAACAAPGADADLPEVEGGDTGGAEGEAPLQGEEDVETDGDAPELAGTMWQLASLNGEPPIADTEITLQFTEADAAGIAGCNQYTGAYTLEGNELTIEEIISTMMACMEPEGVMDQEQAYLGALQGVESARMTGGQLELLDADGSVVLVFDEQQPPANAELEGTNWVLESFVDGDAVSSTIAGTTLTVSFEDGVITGEAGCNSFGGSYEVDGSSLTTEEIASTLVLCEEPEGVMDQEANFLDILNNAESYEIEGGSLTITAGDGRGLVFLAE